MNSSSTSRPICARAWRVCQSIWWVTAFMPPMLASFGFAEPVPANMF
nr:hypothetical protein [Lentzea pudingi]